MRVRCTKAIPGFTVRKTYQTKNLDTKGVIVNDTGHAVVAGPNMLNFFEVVTAEEEKQRLSVKELIDDGHLTPLTTGYDLADGPDGSATLLFVDMEEIETRVAAASHSVLAGEISEEDRVLLLEEIARLSKSYLETELGGLRTIAKVQKRLGPQYVTIKKLQWLLDNVPLTS